MGRTKQSAYRSADGTSSYTQMRSTTTAMNRQYFSSQQAAGGSSTEKKVFINCENTFATFAFARPRATETFQPTASIAYLSRTDFQAQVARKPSSTNPTRDRAEPTQALAGYPSAPAPDATASAAPAAEAAAAPVGAASASADSTTPEHADLYLRLDFPSCLDGALTGDSRPALDLVIVLDVSGSMDSGFPNDTDGRNKLSVAKAGLQRICQQLTARDRIGVVRFNTEAVVIVPVHHATAERITFLNQTVDTLRADGGTSLALGLRRGFETLPNDAVAAERGRLRRVFFLTDMESSKDDEAAVLDLATLYANAPPPVAEQPPAPAAASDAPEDRASVPSIVVDDAAVPEPATSSLQGMLGALGQPLQQIAAAVSSVLPAAMQPAFAMQSQMQSVPAKPDVFNAHLTICGIGVDLSVATVERLSATRGGKYMSVTNSAEFMDTVTASFVYDVTPIAYQIRLTLSPGLQFDRFYGSAELNETKNVATAMISTEFAEKPDAAGCVLGGVYLCRLKVTDAAALTSPALHVGWLDVAGQPQSTTRPLALPEPLPAGQRASAGCDAGLRKAAALMEYVTLLTKYILEGDSGEELDHAAVARRHSFQQSLRSPRGAQGHQRYTPARDYATGYGGPAAGRLVVGRDVYDALKRLSAEEIVALPSEASLPPGCPATITTHYRHANAFKAFREFLLHEMAACSDVTLTTSNQNVLQTVDQIVTLEVSDIRAIVDSLRCREIEADEAAARAAASAATATAAARMEATAGQTMLPADLPRGFVCPITLQLMRDPVTAADGHSYERSAIEQWLQSNTTSPVTNLALASRALLDNHALRQAIQDFVAMRQASSAAAPPGTLPAIPPVPAQDLLAALPLPADLAPPLAPSSAPAVAVPALVPVSVVPAASGLAPSGDPTSAMPAVAVAPADIAPLSAPAPTAVPAAASEDAPEMESA